MKINRQSFFVIVNGQPKKLSEDVAKHVALTDHALSSQLLQVLPRSTTV